MEGLNNMEDYKVVIDNGVIDCSVIVDTKTDGKYTFSRGYLYKTKEEALKLFDREVKLIYELYGRA